MQDIGITGVRKLLVKIRNGLAKILKRHQALLSIVACATLVCFLGVSLHPRLLLLLPALAMVLIVGVGWPWLAMLFVRGSLHFKTERVYECEHIEATLDTRNHAPWPAWGVLFDAGDSCRRMLQTIRPFTTKRYTLNLQPQQRGVFPQRLPRMQTGFPFDLITAGRKAEITRRLLVWPRVLPVAPPPDWASADMAVGHVDSRRIGSEGDTIGVREYRRGDPMRWIHWSQTARHNRFMVREFQASGIPRVRILLDCDADAHVGTGPDSSFEWSVRIAASLASGWLEEGAEVELVAGAVYLPAAGGEHHRRKILDALAKVQLQQEDQVRQLPTTELATILIGTDLAWHKQPETANSTLRGFQLLSHGFGGDSTNPTASQRDLVVIEEPKDVADALLRVKRGLADVA